VVDAWRDLFVRSDLEGLRALEDATSVALRSLNPSTRARSAVSATELRAIAQRLPIFPDEGLEVSEVLKEQSEKVFVHSVWPHHVATVAHLHPPVTVASAASEVLIAAANQSMDSFDQAPLATHIELALLDTVARLLGLPSGATGIMTSGGTASNLLGLTLARAVAGRNLGHDVGRDGLPDEARRWRFLCSNQAHFSVERAAAQLGLGRQSVVRVMTDAHGRLDLRALDHALDEVSRVGDIAVAIVGTAGTTDLGAIDPLAGIAERAHRVGAWFHVDAAVAGAFAVSPALRPRLAGLGDADSVTVDFHKLWWQPFNASALLVRDESTFNILRVASSYLDRGDELDGMVNLVGRSLDTSRRFDAAKVVASLRVLGRRQFSAMLEHLCDLASFAYQVLDDHPLFAPIASPEGVTVVFDAPGYDSDTLRRVQQDLLQRGDMILGRTVVGARPALKFTFMNPLTTTDDVRHLVDAVAREVAKFPA
jgi:L-2,4-diaminobutyrate decarboxylase